MANENIKLIKQFLTNQDANNTIDRSFSELISKRNRVTVPEFFDYYNNLFYDIPRLGTLSHTELINKSIEYLGNYNDPRDQEIRELNLRIDELTSQLNQQEFEEVEQQIANLTTKVIVTLNLEKGDYPNKFSKVLHKDINTHRLMFKDGINDQNFYGSYKQFKTETIEFTTTAPTFTLFYDGRNKVQNKSSGVKWYTGPDKNNPTPVVYNIPEGDNVFPIPLTLKGVEAHSMNYSTFMQENVNAAAEAAVIEEFGPEIIDQLEEAGLLPGGENNP